MYAVRIVETRFVERDSVEAARPTNDPAYMNPPSALHEKCVSAIPIPGNQFQGTSFEQKVLAKDTTHRKWQAIE